MCTLIVLNECIDGYPLIVAGNRDERYDRPSAGPAVFKVGSDDQIIRPHDELKQGTWIGVARDGWFAGLTNQDDGKHDDKLLSRGKIVDEVLATGNHSKAAWILARLELARYNPFNLVFGRPGAMFLFRAHPGYDLEFEPLATGVNVISNDCQGSIYQRKVAHAHALACRIDPASGIEQVRAELLTMLSDHSFADEDPFQALCVHADAHAFGTRSTSIITVSSDCAVEYWYSEGHPCRSSSLSLVGTLPRS